MPAASARKPPRRQGSAAAALRKWLDGHRMTALTSVRRLLATPVSSLLTVFVIAVSLLLPSLLLALSASLDSLLDGVQQETQISLYLDDSVTDFEAQEVSNDLLTEPDITTVRLISKAQALEEFAASSGLGEVLAALDTNPLPATILVTPVSTEPGRMTALAARLADLPAVTSAQVDSQWLRRLEAFSRLVSVAGGVLSLVVLLGLFVIVGNTIKLAIENRRQEIQVIKLVGGTDAYIARPFLYSGVYFGGAGGALAALMQAIVFAIFNSPLRELFSLYEGEFTLLQFGVIDMAALVVAGIVIGWFAALFASLRSILAMQP
jgi:cell division transport system permease protein